MGSTQYRLPRHVTPRGYHVDLDASLKRTGFHGTLRLNAKVHQAVTTFEMHARGLKIDAVRALSGGKRRSGKVTYHPDRETVALTFAQPLSRGPLEVSLSFKGKLNSNMHGLYLARDGAEVALVSQCETTDARAIFPCFDEPDLKATLQWTVRTDPGLQVVTNGIALKRRKTRTTPVREVHTFAPTRVIPSYLAAVTIGAFAATPPESVSHVPCRIWASAGRIGQADFAREVTAQVLPWLEKYFGQRYHYQKLDQVAVPGFDAGAMENVAAIFYRRNLLLMQPESTSWQAQKRIGEVIAHEIAHHWFGNLVTMRWWNDLWLNEAFATWMAHKACAAWKPQWRMWDDFLDAHQSALAADALVSTHPVCTEVTSPAQATELFDVITYEKGGAVLRMVEEYLGETAMRDGIRAYLAAYRNKNAHGAQFWEKIAAASGQPVNHIVERWIYAPGFPLVTVTPSMHAGRTHLHLSQHRFFADAHEMQRDHPDTWAIPLSVRYDLGNGPAVMQVLLAEREMTVALPEEGHARWVYPNAAATGFFRVQLHDEALRNLLKEGLNHLSPAARSNLIEDQWALVRCALSDVEQFMDVVAAFRDERDHVVVRTLTKRLAYLNEFLVPPNSRADLGALARWLLAPQLTELGWDSEPDEPPAKAVRRASVISALGDIGRDAAVLRQACQRAEQELHQPESVEANLAGVVLELAALQGGIKFYDQCIKSYLDRKTNGASPELAARVLRALVSFEAPALQQRTLNHCLDGTIPQEQWRTVLVTMLADSTTQTATWTFLKQHWPEIGPRIGSMGVARLVEATGALPASYADEITRFFAAHPIPEAERALQKALETMAIRHELVQREASRLTDWLNAFSREA